MILTMRMDLLNLLSSVCLTAGIDTCQVERSNQLTFWNLAELIYVDCYEMESWQRGIWEIYPYQSYNRLLDSA